MKENFKLALEGNEVKGIELPAEMGRALANTELTRTDEYGTYFKLCKPIIEGEAQPLAVKLLDRNEDGYAIGLEQIEKVGTEVFQQFLDSATNIHLEGREGKLIFEELKDEEKVLTLLAYEHNLHEKLYPGYVRPAVFVSFSLKNNLEDSFTLEGEDFDEYREGLKLEGHLTEDNRKIYFKKGEVMMAMVQDFVEMSESIFLMPEAELDEDKAQQIEVFAGNVQKVYLETGYYPDPSMDHPVSKNVVFVDGKLNLMDSNSIRKSNGPKGELRIVTLMKMKVENARKLRKNG